MTDQELKHIVAELASAVASVVKVQERNQAEVARLRDETTARSAATNGKIARLLEMIGGISISQGLHIDGDTAIAEGFFFTRLADNPMLGGILYDIVQRKVYRKKGAVEREYDLLLVNGEAICAIEVKYRAQKQDLIDMLHSKIPAFKELFPEYEGYQHHWALATFHIDDNLKQEFLSKGISVIQRKGDLVETQVAK